MDKGSNITTVNQKRSAPKQPKTNKKKQQQPLKVVYITNPIKFKATASEFRALVQELTGQDADMSESSAWFSADGVGATGEFMDQAKKPGQEPGSVHHELYDEMEEGRVLGHMMTSTTTGGQSRSSTTDPSNNYEDVFYTSPQEMMMMMDAAAGFGSGCDDDRYHIYKSLV